VLVNNVGVLLDDHSLTSAGFIRTTACLSSGVTWRKLNMPFTPPASCDAL